MTQVFLLTRDQFKAAEEARMELGGKRQTGEIQDGRVGASLAEVLAPGAMWEAYWWFEPTDPACQDRRRRALERIEQGESARDYLSKFYWQTWSQIRAPYCVLCPNGEEWCIDAKSSNGDGWQVTGTAPRITAMPSIVVTGYHGWLKDGAFSPDIENRGPTGVRRLGPYRGK